MIDNQINIIYKFDCKGSNIILVKLDNILKTPLYSSIHSLTKNSKAR